MIKNAFGSYEFMEVNALVDLGDIKNKFFQVDTNGMLTSIELDYYPAKNKLEKPDETLIKGYKKSS